MIPLVASDKGRKGEVNGADWVAAAGGVARDKPGAVNRSGSVCGNWKCKLPPA